MNKSQATLLITMFSTLSAGIVQALVEDEAYLSAGVSGDGIRSVMDGTGVATRQGFSPRHCAPGEAPPAELLTLADWPLDQNGTCTPHGLALAARTEDSAIEPVVAIVEVVEASIRPVSTRPLSAGVEVVEAIIRPVSRNTEEVLAHDDQLNRIIDAYGDIPAIVPADAPAPVVAVGEHGRAYTADATRIDVGETRPLAQPKTHTVRDLRQPDRASSVGPLRPIRLAEAPAMADTDLDTLRGGFEAPSGLRVSFGIERAVFVNGVLASVTTVNLADLGQLSGRGLPAGSTVAVIQNGPNNTFVGNALNAGALATVIQNSLDNQNIRAITTINATVNSMEMLRSGQMGQSMRDAMVHSLMR